MHNDLVARAQAGDKSAFSVLAAASIDRMHAIARLIVRDPHAADDAVQDALVAAWRDLRALRQPGRFEAWLYRILIRYCHRSARNRRRQHVTEIPLPGEDRHMAADEHSVLLMRDQLEAAFRRLSPDQRAVLVLHHYLGLPLGESAEILSIPVGTMKSRVNRATQAMRAAIEADERMAALPMEHRV
jgi:RNA polymerase sigma factor (sigma-70 family)